MKVSIVIPIFNVGNYLEDCLRSCVHQTYKDIEIICVNDGSTDNSQEIIRRFQSQDSRITCVDKVNGGLPSAREAGVQAVTGDYIFHLDGDDNMPDDTIEKMVSVAIREDADLVVGDYQIIENNAGTVVNSHIEHNLTSEEYIKYILTKRLFNIWGKLIKTSLYRDNPIAFPHHISMAEDLIQTFQLAHFAKKISPCHEVCCNYYIRSSSMSKTDGIVGALTDRSIFAVCYICELNKKYSHPSTDVFLHQFVLNFIYSYLCSPYKISLRRKELNFLLKTLSVKSLCTVKNKSRRLLMLVALINIDFAKFLTKVLRNSKNVTTYVH